MPTIAEILARRSDLSTFVVHLTRDTTSPARDNLAGILSTHKINALSPFGPATSKLAAAGLQDCLASQQVVCFTETPLEHLHLLLAEITDLKRACEFQPYGIAFTKRVARDSGVNPVWYTDITPNGQDWLMNSVNTLISEAVQAVSSRRAAGDATAHFKDYPIAKLAPFIEQMGSGTSASGPYRKEFWWEREWRYRGDFLLPLRYIVLAPAAEHDIWRPWIKQHIGIEYPLLDPRWGLEEIIGRLAGFSDIQIRAF